MVQKAQGCCEEGVEGLHVKGLRYVVRKGKEGADFVETEATGGFLAEE